MLHDGNTPCHRHELLLPPLAPDILLDVDRLVAHYTVSQRDDERDLLVIFTVRFPREMAFHQQFRLARGYADKVVCERSVACVVVAHQPGFVGYAEVLPELLHRRIAQERRLIIEVTMGAVGQVFAELRAEIATVRELAEREAPPMPETMKPRARAGLAIVPPPH